MASSIPKIKIGNICDTYPRDKRTGRRVRPSFHALNASIRALAKRGIAVANDGRCYIPNSRSGR